MYPYENLSVLGPIVLVLLLVGFPIIGVFAGWKRGLYWGGGNLLFYIIGMLIWRFCSEAIGGCFSPIVNQILNSAGISGDTTQIAISISAIIWFIGWQILANIFLVINYYAWFKRVVKLGMYAKKLSEEEKKAEEEKQKIVFVKGKGACKKNFLAIVKNKKIINYVCGALAVGVLTIPTTLALTETVVMTTTSSRARANNKCYNDFYNAFISLDKSNQWFSYYCVTDTPTDVDSAYGIMNISKVNMSYTNPWSQQKSDKTILDSSIETYTWGYNQSMYCLITDQEYERPDEERIVDTIDNINKFAKTWNAIIDANSYEFISAFSARSTIDLVCNYFVKQEGKTKIMVNESQFDKIMANDDQAFAKLIKAYKEGKYIKADKTEVAITKLRTIALESDMWAHVKICIDNLFDLTFTNLDKVVKMKQNIDELYKMIFVIKE